MSLPDVLVEQNRTTDVKEFRKFAEGGYDRTFKVTMHDGFQVIARLPYPSTCLDKLATAGEVATMDLIRSFGISAPKIFDYSATAHSSVGSEYITMENYVERTLETPSINYLRAEEYE